MRRLLREIATNGEVTKSDERTHRSQCVKSISIPGMVGV